MEEVSVNRAPSAAPHPELDDIGAPMRASRRDAVGRFALLAADFVALAGAMGLLAVVTSARFSTWILALLPLIALLAKSAGLYDRDQYVLHKTTLEEGPSLVGMAAIVALLTEAFQALSSTAAHSPCCSGGR